MAALSRNATAAMRVKRERRDDRDCRERMERGGTTLGAAMMMMMMHRSRTKMTLASLLLAFLVVGRVAEACNVTAGLYDASATSSAPFHRVSRRLGGGRGVRRAKRRIRRQSMLIKGADVRLQIVDHRTFALDGERISFRKRDLRKVGTTVFEILNRTEDRIFVSIVKGKLQDAVKMMKGSNSMMELMPVRNIQNVYSSIHLDDLNQTEMEQNVGVDHVEPPKWIAEDDDEARRNLETKPIPHPSEPCTSYQIIRVAFRYDAQFCAMNDSSGLKSKAKVESIVAIANTILERPGLCKRVEICQLRGECRPAGQDPHDVTGLPLRKILTEATSLCGGAGSAVDRFRLWMHPRGSAYEHVGCDLTHLLFANDPDGGRPANSHGTVGCAYIGALCNAAAVGISNMGFHPSTVLQASLLTHELAHSMKAVHTDEDRVTIMGKTVCECDSFTDENLKAMNEYVNKRDDDQCIGNVDAVQPQALSGAQAEPTGAVEDGEAVKKTPDAHGLDEPEGVKSGDSGNGTDDRAEDAGDNEKITTSSTPIRKGVRAGKDAEYSRTGRTIQKGVFFKKAKWKLHHREHSEPGNNRRLKSSVETRQGDPGTTRRLQRRVRGQR